MAFVSLVFGQGQSEIGAIPLDALLSEATNLDSTVTDYAVEQGAPVTDHIVRRPEVVRLSGTITAAGIVLFGGGGRSKLIAAKDQFRTLHENSELVSVITGMDAYEDMAIQSLRLLRDNSGVKLTVDCTLKHVRKVTIRRAEIPPEIAAPATNEQGESLGKGTGAKGKAGETQDAGKQEPVLESELFEKLEAIRNNVGELF